MEKVIAIIILFAVLYFLVKKLKFNGNIITQEPPFDGINNEIKKLIPKENFNFDMTQNEFIRNHVNDPIEKSDLINPKIWGTPYNQQINNQDREINEIYDNIVEPRIDLPDQKEIYIDAKQLPGHNNSYVIQMDNYKYYDNENYVNGGVDPLTNTYAFDPTIPNYSAISFQNG